MENWSQILLVLGCLAQWMVISAQPEDNECTPPSIKTIRDQRDLYYTENSEGHLQYFTGGSGHLRVTWLRNGQPIDVADHAMFGHVSSHRTSASLMLVAVPLHPGVDDDGSTLQCKVSNDCGTSVSNMTTLHLVVLGEFPNVPTRHVQVAAGSSVILPCVPPRSVPAASTSWLLTQEGEHNQIVVLDNRVATDFLGNLHITRVLPEDSHDGAVYTCLVVNTWLQAVTSGDRVILDVTNESGGNMSSPVQLIWCSPSHIVALLSTIVKMKCIFSGNPQPEVTWRQGGHDLNLTRMSSDHFELTIEDVQFQDAGEYTWTGEQGSSRLSHTFTLTVEASPTWREEPHDQVVSAGGDTVFMCEPQGVPLPVVRWSINGRPIDQAPANPRRVLSNNSLVFIHVELSDTQVLQCNASNKHGYIYQDFYLMVRECRPPGVSGRATLQYFSTHQETVVIPCPATGTGHLQFQWYRNGQALQESRPYYEIHTTSQRSFLVVKGGSLDDGAVFQCKVTNDCGTSVSDLTVLRLAVLGRLPSWSSRELRVRPGSSVILRCIPPRSVPRPFLFWEHGDEEDAYDMSENRFVPLDNRVTMDYDGNLYITSVQPEDVQHGSQYRCNTLNKQLRAVYLGGTTTLNILGGTSEDHDIQIMWHSPTDVLTLEGSTAEFKCIFSGNPAPNITWTRLEGEDMSPTASIDQVDGQMSPTASIDHFELKLANVQLEDGGQYQCIGHSPLTQHVQNVVFTLQVAAKPSWVAPPEDQVAHLGVNVTFSCEAQGRPYPALHWFINGVPIQDAPYDPHRTLTGNRLIFSYVDYSDSQVIQCNVSNVHGYVWSDVYLHVVGNEDQDTTVTPQPILV